MLILSCSDGVKILSTIFLRKKTSITISQMDPSVVRVSELGKMYFFRRSKVPLKFQAKTHLSLQLRHKIFLVGTLVGIIGPVFAVLLPHVLFVVQPKGLLFACAVCIGFSCLNYFWFLKQKQFQPATVILSGVLTLCFSAGLFYSGGLHSNILIFFPLFPVLNGFLNGIKGVFWTTVYLVALAFGLSYCGSIGVIAHVVTTVSPLILSIEVSTCLVFVGALTYLFDYIRGTSEAHLITLNKALRAEKGALILSENLLNDAQCIAKIGSWKFDLLNHSISWSHETYKIFEISAPQSQDELYRLYRDRIHPDEIAKLDELVAHAKKTGEGYTYNHRLVFEGGRVKHVQGIGRVIQDEGGKIASISGTCQDLTESVRSSQMTQLIQQIEQAIAVSVSFEGLIHNLIASATQSDPWAVAGYWHVNSENADLKLLGVETAQLERFQGFIEHTRQVNFKRGEGLPGRVQLSEQVAWIAKIADDENFPRRPAALKCGLRGGLAFPITVKGDVIGIFEVFSENIIEPIPSLNLAFMAIGARVGLAIEKLKSEQLIDDQQIKLVEASKLASLGEMSAGIAHEINNPLTIISGSLGLLSMCANNPEKFSAKIEVIQKACGRIAKIVSGLKKFSRTTGEKNYSNHDLSEIVRETLVLTNAKSKQHDTPVTCDFKSEALIHCDEIEIEQVVINLINNSIDAVKDRDEKWVKIEVFEENLEGAQLVVLRVTDSGPGIPEKIRDKLFNPFFTTKAVGEGTGLGLSIAKGILNEHEATISLVAGVPNTCFEIRFQKVAAADAAVAA